MDNKKGAFFAVVFSLLSVSLVSAYYFPDFRGVSQGIVDFYVDFFEPILGALFGGFGWSGLYLFERLLLFILLVSLIYLSVGKFDLFAQSKAIRWTISIILPLIGIRMIDYEQLTAILTQYQILSIALTSILPFLIYFFFIYNVGQDYDWIRKSGWLLFIFIYFGLWTTTGVEDYSVIYFWTMAASIGCFLFDNTIMRRYRALALLKKDRYSYNNAIGEINRTIRELHSYLNHGDVPDRKATEAQIKDLERHKKWLSKQL